MRAEAGSRQAEAGVTLVEILVVLSIIAITAGAVMLRLGLGRSGDALTGGAQQLAMAVTQASDAALASGEDRVLDYGPQGYRLHPASMPEAGWIPLPDLTLDMADGVAGPLRLAADGTSEPFELRLSQGDRSVRVHYDGLRAVAGAVSP